MDGEKQRALFSALACRGVGRGGRVRSAAGRVDRFLARLGLARAAARLDLAGGRGLRLALRAAAGGGGVGGVDPGRRAGRARAALRA